MSSRGSNDSRRSTRSTRSTAKTPEKTPRKLNTTTIVEATPEKKSRSNGSNGHAAERALSPQAVDPRNRSRGSVNSSQTTVDPRARSTHNSSNFGILSDPTSPLNWGTSSDPVQKLNSSQQSRVSGTSFKKRVDIPSDTRFQRVINTGTGSASERGILRSVNERSDDVAGGTAAGTKLEIWGTDVDINVCTEKFKAFIKCLDFTLKDLDSDELQIKVKTDKLLENVDPLYMLKLEEICQLEEPFLNVNCAHILQFDEELYRQLVSYPQEVIPTFDAAANEIFFEKFPDAQIPHQINVRPFNTIKSSCLRSLNPEDINALQTVSGMVIRCSNIIPEMCEAYFECSICSSNISEEVDRGRIQEPVLCRNCNTKHCFRLIHNRSRFIDKQQIKLQESPDDMPAGQTPYTVLLYACADLVDKVQPGDRVTVTGVFRATPVRMNPRMRSVKSIYRTHIDVVHFRKLDNKRLHDDEEKCNFSEEEIDKFKALSRIPDIYERLARALAPSIYEHDDIKKGILLQLFGGTRKEINSNRSDSAHKHFRSEINILLCGDPGTSKSQLLQYVYNLVPRGRYTSGKGSSAVGLTAYITKDPDTRQMVLQTGALVLCDGGICCIDEFDKMTDATRSVLHEVMEQQTLSIAKAGIVCQLNARTSILAAANPLESQWNTKKTIIENIQLPHTLMSRFDLIFLLLDPQDDAYDRRLGKHLVSLYYRTKEEEEEIVSMSMLKDYIAYSRGAIKPRLNDEASEILVHAYLEMRKVGAGRGHVSAYPRQLEALIRLAEGRAKVRLSKTVEVEDVEEARRLHREALKQSATDPSSGKIDISILTTGLSSTNRKRKAELTSALKQLLDAKSMRSSEMKSQEHVFSFATVHNELKQDSTTMITREMFEDALKELEDDGYLTSGGKVIRLC